MSNFQRPQRSASAPEIRLGRQAPREPMIGHRTLEQWQVEQARIAGANLAKDLSSRPSKLGMKERPTLVVDVTTLFDISSNPYNVNCWQPLLSGFVEQGGQIKIMARDQAQLRRVRNAIAGSTWSTLTRCVWVEPAVSDLQRALQEVLDVPSSPAFLMTTDPTLKQMVPGRPGLLLEVKRGTHSSSLMPALVQKLQASFGLYPQSNALTANSVEFSVTSEQGPQSFTTLRNAIPRPVASLPAVYNPNPRRIPVYPAGTGPDVVTTLATVVRWPRPVPPVPLVNPSVSPARRIETPALSPERPNVDLVWGPERAKQPQPIAHSPQAAQSAGPQLPGAVAVQGRAPAAPKPMPGPPALAAHSPILAQRSPFRQFSASPIAGVFAYSPAAQPPIAPTHSPQHASRVGPSPLKVEPEARIPERVQSFKPLVYFNGPMPQVDMRRTQSVPPLNSQAQAQAANGAVPVRLAADRNSGPVRLPHAPAMQNLAAGRAYSLPSQAKLCPQPPAQFRPVQGALHHGRPMGPLISMAPVPAGAMAYPVPQVFAGYHANGYERVSASPPPRQAPPGVPYGVQGQRMRQRPAYPQSPANRMGGAMRTGGYASPQAYSPASPARCSVWG